MKLSVLIIFFILQFLVAVEAKENLFELTRNDQVVANSDSKVFSPIDSDIRVLVPGGSILRVLDVKTESFHPGTLGIPDIVGFKTYYFERNDCNSGENNCLFKIRQGISNQFSSPTLQTLGLSTVD